MKWAAVCIIGAVILRTHLPPAVHQMLVLTPEMKCSVALWVVFSVYWEVASRRTAAAQSSESKWSRAVHLLLVNLAVVVLVFPIPGLTKRFLPVSTLLVGAGLVMQIAAIALAVWARRVLGQNWSGEVRIATEHQLIRTGPYQFLRHPIYTAVLGMYCGTLLVSGQIHAPVGLLIVTLAYWRKLRLEESALSAAFGLGYESYKQRRWALLPFVF